MDMGRKQTIKPDKPTRMPGLKNIAKGGLRVGGSEIPEWSDYDNVKTITYGNMWGRVVV